MALHEEIIIAGFGGQGVLAMGRLLAYAAMVQGKNVSWLPSYGPEMRGGTANCNVVLSDDLVGSPVVSKATCLIVLNTPSLDKFEDSVIPGGKILVNSSLIERKVKRKDVEVHYYPVNDIALKLENLTVTNMVMLGAFSKLIGFPDKDKISESLIKVFGERKKHLFAVNESALKMGRELVK